MLQVQFCLKRVILPMQQVKEQVCSLSSSHTGSCTVELWIAHSCTELDQTLRLCRINFCLLFISPRSASAFARMTNRVQMSLAESSQTHMKVQCLWCCFGVSEAKEQSLQGMEHLEHMVHRGLSAHCWLLTLQFFQGSKFREIEGREKWGGSVNTWLHKWKTEEHSLPCRGRDF